jgi:S-formylglutathione hydrolase FrmB
MSIVRHEIPSAYQAGRSQIDVLLPDSLPAARLCPTLYVLPALVEEEAALGDGLGEIERLGLHNRYNVVSVRPRYNAVPWYADHPADPGLRQERHLLDAVLPFVERELPVASDPARRFLVGFSKSGWGAYSLLLRHPGLFGRAAAWDAPLMQDRPDRWGMPEVFATQENFECYRIAALLERRADLLRRSPRLILMGYGNFREHDIQAHALMLRLGVAHEYVAGPWREHRWDSGWLPEALARLLRAPGTDGEPE